MHNADRCITLFHLQGYGGQQGSGFSGQQEGYGGQGGGYSGQEGYSGQVG